MSAWEAYAALRSEGWSEEHAFAAVAGPLEARVDELRRLVPALKPKRLKTLSWAQRRCLRLLNRAEVQERNGDRAGAMISWSAGRHRGIERALERRGLVKDGRLTPAGWAWIEQDDGG